MSARKVHSPPSGWLFRIGMHTDMKHIEVRHHHGFRRAGMFGLIDKFRVDRRWLTRIVTLALGFAILTGDVRDISRR